MKQVNIAVFVSGGGTNLQALIDSEKNGVLKSGKIKLVVSSQPGAYALERAANAGIPSVVVNKKAAGTSEAFEAQLERNLKEHDIDLIILAGFLSILSGDFTAKYRDRILNVHPSLIPSFCCKGMYGLKWYMRPPWKRGSRLRAQRCILLIGCRTAVKFYCKRQWRYRTEIPPKFYKEELWNKPNGFCCQGRRSL